MLQPRTWDWTAGIRDDSAREFIFRLFVQRVPVCRTRYHRGQVVQEVQQSEQEPEIEHDGYWVLLLALVQSAVLDFTAGPRKRRGTVTVKTHEENRAEAYDWIFGGGTQGITIEDCCSYIGVNQRLLHRSLLEAAKSGTLPKPAMALLQKGGQL